MRRNPLALEDAGGATHSRGGAETAGAGVAVVLGTTSIVGRRGKGAPTRQFGRTPGAMSSSAKGGGGGGGPYIAD